MKRRKELLFDSLGLLVLGIVIFWLALTTGAMDLEYWPRPIILAVLPLGFYWVGYIIYLLSRALDVLIDKIRKRYLHKEPIEEPSTEWSR